MITEVRRFLEDAGFDPSDVLAAGRGGYRLRLPDGVVVDIDEARESLTIARDELAAAQAVGAERERVRE